MPDGRRGRKMPVGEACCRYRHGHATNGQKSPEYLSWRAMRARCANPKNPAYPRYGGRGITVCTRWMTFENFLADMGARPAGLSLDRIDNDRGYEPGNCRWATRREQAANQRGRNLVVIAGVSDTLQGWQEKYRLSDGLVRYRMRQFGWPAEQAITTPKQRRRINRHTQTGNTDA